MILEVLEYRWLQSHIIGIDANRDAHGRLLCDTFIWYQILKTTKKWLQRILQINKLDKIDVLLVFSEGETLIISENKLFLKRIKLK